MTPRLTSAMLVSAMIRRVQQAGGAAAVIAKGDATAGAIVLTCLERGVATGSYERVLQSDGRYAWAPAGPPNQSLTDSDEWLSRRRMRDPDLWIVELDIADAERFAAETSGDG